MEVEGSFDNWSTRQLLQRTGKDYTIIKLLPPGVYQVRTRNTKHMTSLFPFHWFRSVGSAVICGLEPIQPLLQGPGLARFDWCWMLWKGRGRGVQRV